MADSSQDVSASKPHSRDFTAIRGYIVKANAALRHPENSPSVALAALDSIEEQYEKIHLEHVRVLGLLLASEEQNESLQNESLLRDNETLGILNETLKQQLETCRGLLKQALDENIRLRTALTMIRDHRSPGGSQLISGREAEAIAWAALQPSGGAGLADPSDLSRAPVAGATPPVSNPADIHSDGDIHNDCENGLSGDPARSRPCEDCDGIGAQAGAHTERVEPCPACDGSGRKKVEAQG